jgi:hypothetical protein
LSFNIQLATQSQLDKWDYFVYHFVGGTIFHERSFLNYHGSRFAVDEHFLVVKKGEAIVSLLPALVEKSDDEVKLISPYGGSFGGPIFTSKLSLKDAIAIFDLYQKYFNENGFKNIIYTIPPALYSENTDVIEYCLFRNGYAINKMDVFNILFINDTPWKINAEYEGRVRTTLRKEKEQFRIKKDSEVEKFYEILLIDKKEKSTTPIHTLKDLQYLKKVYPDRMRIDSAFHEETGAKFAICYFKVNKYGWMTFYMAQDRKELKLNGITVLIDEFLCEMSGKYKFLDFGSSTFGFNISNIGISNFKEGFGTTTQLRKTLAWKL